jgi:Uma2 family endonuclease
MPVQVLQHRFTVSDYHRMRDSGILGEADRVELIDGEIRQMSPIDPIHAATVKRLSHHLFAAVGQRAILSVQDPVELNDLTEPQPDLALLRWDDDFYEHQHPTPADVLIVIEVANSSIDYDREEKLPRYAAAGIPEVWLVHIARQVVEQYTLPVGDDYTYRRIVKRGSMVTAQTITGIEVAVDSIFGH